MFAEGALVNRKYRILAELGQGSLGLSYKALVLGSNTIRVIKVLDASLVPSLIPRESVEQAVAKSNELRHPAVLRWQAAEYEGAGGTILVRDFAEGPSLKSTIAGGVPFEVPRACHIVRQTALALDAAQRLKLVHGDLRPDNMILCPSEGAEQVRILDFGMARLRENFTYSLHRLTLKDPGPLMGDPHYLSPEQATGLRADSLDGRCDIYSLGVIFWQLLTGRLPSPEPPLESLMWHVMGTLPGLRECYPDLKIPEDLDQLIHLMLAKSREKRLESARTVVQRLEIFEGLHGRARARAIQAPSFALLSDRNKAKPDARTLEPPAPKVKPAETKVANVVPSPQTPAAILPVESVEIAPAGVDAAGSIESLAPSRGTAKVWVTAASILIAVVGMGAAGYYFRSKIPWKAANSINQARFDNWGRGLEASLHTSAQKIETGLHSWSRRMEQQYSSRPSAPIPAAGQQSASTSLPPVIAQASNTPAADLAISASDAPPNAHPATPAAGQSTQNKKSAQGDAELSQKPATPAETTKSRMAKESKPLVKLNPAEARTATHSQPEKANTASTKPVIPVPVDSAALARMIAANLKNGDRLFELGQYDQAILDYRQGLTLDPANKVLLDRIARAKRAQAAEAEFLNQ
ncbi:MAG TPA: protein kinase [Terriglobia bacterium]|nr:protein kinase [Terriglobia bacterium]